MRKIAVSFFIEPEKIQSLKEMGENENKNMSALIREAIEKTYFNEQPLLEIDFTAKQKMVLDSLNLEPTELARVAVNEWFLAHLPNEVLENVE